MVKIGQKVLRMPQTFIERHGGTGGAPKPVWGKVVYIHPKGRYHTVEFDLTGGKVLESFKGVED